MKTRTQNSLVSRRRRGITQIEIVGVMSILGLVAGWVWVGVLKGGGETGKGGQEGSGADGGLLEVVLEAPHPLAQLQVTHRQHLYGEHRSVEGVVDADGGDRHAGRQLGEAVQRV